MVEEQMANPAFLFKILPRFPPHGDMKTGGKSENAAVRRTFLCHDAVHAALRACATPRLA
ncbi:MAG: hypothetical protein Q3986_07190 [Akkermansia sp.]|nr:hypothetical protein [Akkermansia sp.]